MSRTNALTLLGLLALAGSSTALVGMAARPTPAPMAAANADAQTFEIDPVHSTAMFKISHMGVSNFYGRFNGISGSFKTDSKAPLASTIAVSIKADSVDTNNAQREEHIKGPDFFNAKQFPTISFKSTAISKGADGKLSLTGDLTLLGVTKPITATVEFTGEKDASAMKMGYRAGLEASFKVKRSDFGMTTYVKEGVLGDEVSLTISLEGVKK